MNSHRVLASLACAALLISLGGCEMDNPYKHTYPASRSESNMRRNTQWQVTGEEKPQVPMPEDTPAPTAPAAAPAK